MLGYKDDMGSGFEDYTRVSYEEIIREKDRLISLQERDMESLKREITSLKDQLNTRSSKRK